MISFAESPGRAIEKLLLEVEHPQVVVSVSGIGIKGEATLVFLFGFLKLTLLRQPSSKLKVLRCGFRPSNRGKEQQRQNACPEKNFPGVTPARPAAHAFHGESFHPPHSRSGRTAIRFRRL